MSDSFIPVIAAAVLAVLCLPAIGHFQAGAIDHHNAQIALLLALVLMTAQIEQSAIKAAIGGLTASLSLAIGVEMLPAIAATGVAVVGLFIWRGAPIARQVAAFGAGLAGSSLLLAPALLPLSSLNNQVCDAFGGPVLLLTIGGGTTLMVMVAIDRSFQTLRMRIVSGAALAIILGGAFLALFPDCAAPPYAHLDPLLVSLWISNVAEAMPFTKILHLLPEKAFLVYGFTIMSLGFAIAALIRAPAPERFRDRRHCAVGRADRGEHLAGARRRRCSDGGGPSARGKPRRLVARAHVRNDVTSSVRRFVASWFCGRRKCREAVAGFDREVRANGRSLALHDALEHCLAEAASEGTHHGAFRPRTCDSRRNQPRRLRRPLPP